MNVRFAKRLDRLLGRPLANLLPPPSKCTLAAAPRSILLIRPGGIGDAVLLAPTINQLKNSYPDVTITVLAERRNAGVFALVPAMDRVSCYDLPTEFLAALRKRYDVVIDTEQWHRLSAVAARLIRAQIKIGFSTNERQRMFTHAVAYSHDDYEKASFFALLAPLGIDLPIQNTSGFLAIPPDTDTVVSRLLVRQSVMDRKLVVIFPSASIVERRWGVERFRQVAEIMTSRGYCVVVVGGGEDQLEGEKIVAGGGLNLAGRTTLAETAAILEQSQLLISGDSGILHIAVGLDVPTVSLFGPGRALKWAPRGDKHLVLNKHLPCSPCTTFGTTPPCPYNARCMQEITVDEVVESALALLKKSRATIVDRP